MELTGGRSPVRSGSNCCGFSGASHLTVLHITAPATGEALGTAPLLDRSAVDLLVSRARAAQPAWTARSLSERARLLLRFRDRLVARAEEVASTSCRETGKLMVEALITDVLTTAGIAAWCAKRAQAVLGPRRVPSGWLLNKRCYELREPYGVVAVIAPWNWPVLNSMRAVLPAIVAGNTVILKPSEASPFSGLLMRELADEAGWPEDIFLIATGDGATGAALTAAAIDRLSFTGGLETGRHIARAAAERLLPVSLELGGKDAMIVLAGADIDRAADAALVGAFANTGQICTSLERVYVEAPVYDEFVERVTRQALQLRVGAGEDADVGAVTVAPQLTRIDTHVRDAVARGARVLAGGAPLDRAGRFYAPTVLVDVSHDMSIMRDETFGPVLPIMKVHDADEAIRLANDSRYALGSSIWGPTETAEALVRRIRAGMTSVNDAIVNGLVPGLPFGGVGDSGTGRVHGDEGLREMSWSRAVLVDRWGVRDTKLYPLARIGTDTALALVHFVAGRGMLRWHGLRRLLRRLVTRDRGAARS